jgi:integrase/recombinase XerD
VRAFQVHLVAGGISWPALNQTVCALRFLYGVTLKQADLPERIKRNFLAAIYLAASVIWLN